jgi:hypothetical protein
VPQSQNPRTKSEATERSPAELVEVLLDATEHSVGSSHLFSPPPDKRPDQSLTPEQPLIPDQPLTPDEPLTQGQPLTKQPTSPAEGADKAKKIALAWAAVSGVLIALTWLAATLSG